MSFDFTKKCMSYEKNYISLKGGPEPSKKIIPKVLSPISHFQFTLFQYQEKSDRIILPGTFLELDKVCSEVPADSRVLRVRRLWFPTSDRLRNDPV